MYHTKGRSTIHYNSWYIRGQVKAIHIQTVFSHCLTVHVFIFPFFRARIRHLSRNLHLNLCFLLLKQTWKYKVKAPVIHNWIYSMTFPFWFSMFWFIWYDQWYLYSSMHCTRGDGVRQFCTKRLYKMSVYKSWLKKNQYEVGI